MTTRMFSFRVFPRPTRGGWFRLFGYGLTWCPADQPLLFSQRVGKTKFVTVAGWRVRVLRPERSRPWP